MTDLSGINTFSKEETLKAKSIAILLLIFHHMFLSKDAVSTKIVLNLLSADIISNLARDARFCVWIFVFLSAYGITIGYGKFKGRNTAFFFHRVLMLQKFCLPILFIYYILAIIFGQSREVLNNPLYIALNILGLSDLIDFPALGGGYWYITFTILLALFFPFFYNICEKYSYLVIPMAIILFQGYINLGIHSSSGGYYVQYILAVFLGILFAQKNIWNKIGKINKWSIKIPLFIVLITCIIIMPNIRNTFFPEDILQIKQILMTTAAIAVCCITFLFCREKRLCKLMIFIGKHSANMYLLHPLVLNYLGRQVYFSKNLLISYLTCFLICIASSILLEAVLKYCGYNKLINKLDCCICK
ncbi:MAG: acyltransferase [Lachnospiraceae bacterium]